MNKKTNRLIKIGFAILFIVIILVRIYYTKKANRETKEWLNSIHVEFSGKIINKQEVTRGGRPILIVCIKVDYSNTDSIILQSNDKFRYLKISDKIATMVIPSELYNIDYIAINLNNDRMEKYYKDGVLKEEYPLSLNCAYATEKDLQMCDNLK